VCSCRPTWHDISTADVTRDTKLSSRVLKQPRERIRNFGVPLKRADEPLRPTQPGNNLVANRDTHHDDARGFPLPVPPLPIAPARLPVGLVGAVEHSLLPVAVQIVRPFVAASLPRCLEQLALFVDAAIGRTRMKISRANNRHAITPPLRRLRVAHDREHVRQRGQPLRLGCGRDILRQRWRRLGRPVPGRSRHGRSLFNRGKNLRVTKGAGIAGPVFESFTTPPSQRNFLQR
jgi:hypothetical protein